MSIPTKRSHIANKPSPTIDQRIVKAISHPLRFRLLLAYNERVASPNELAKALEEPLGNVAYHTRILLDLDAIELVDTAQRRGATEHYYRAIMRPYFSEEDYAQLPITTRRALMAPILRAIMSDVSAAAVGDGLDDPKVHVSRTKLDLDEQGYEELASELATVLERALEIQAECVGRWLEAGGEGPPPIATELAILHFMRDGGASTE